MRGWSVIDVIDQNRINSLALKYAKSGGEDQDAFTDLFYLVDPIIKAEARRSEERTGIPRTTYEDAYWVAVWKAAKRYDGSCPFEYWVRMLLKQARYTVHRDQNRKKRSIYEESLENRIADSGDADRTVYKLKLWEDPIEEFISETATKKMLVDFSQSNEHYGKVINLLSVGCTGQEIAKHIGASLYDAKTRKTVQLARQRFQTFLQSKTAS